MNNDLQLRNLLQTDAEAVRRVARLPSAQGMLWRLKLRSARAQRRRAARTVALAQAACAALAALGLLAWTVMDGAPAQSATWILAASAALWTALSWLVVIEVRRGA